MKVLFKNITKYDKENRENLVNFHINKYGKKELTKFVLMVLVFTYVFISNLIYKNWYSILMLLVLAMIMYLVYKIKENKENKKNKNIIKEYTFCFYDKYIKIRYRRQYQKILYLNIKKIFETDRNFFLYTDDKHSLILDKEGFIIGNSENFPEFIKKKCPFKYRNETNK